MKIKVYGCRGSIPQSQIGSRFGGNTSCLTVTSGGETLVVDAGSGLAVYEKEMPQGVVNILLGHLHFDHIIGLSTFSPVWNQGDGVCVYTCSRDSRPLKEQILAPFSPPYWPKKMSETANLRAEIIEADKTFDIGVFTVTAFAANHPDNTLSFHITDGRCSLVYLLDSEVTGMSDELKKYCEKASMVVFDATFAPDDYAAHKGWGHSTVLDGVRLAEECGCKKMLFAHFHQKYSDKELVSWNRYFRGSGFIIAWDGYETELMS